MKKTHEVKLKPCYPKGTTAKEQIEKLLIEYQEVEEATDKYNEAEEYVDVAQVAVGLVDIWGCEVEKANVEFRPNYHRTNSAKLLINRFKKGKYNGVLAQKLVEVSLEAAYSICRMISCDFRSLLKCHKDKIKKVRKQMEDGTYGA